MCGAYLLKTKEKSANTVAVHLAHDTHFLYFSLFSSQTQESLTFMCIFTFIYYIIGVEKDETRSMKARRVVNRLKENVDVYMHNFYIFFSVVIITSIHRPN